ANAMAGEVASVIINKRAAPIRSSLVSPMFSLSVYIAAVAVKTPPIAGRTPFFMLACNKAAVTLRVSMGIFGLSAVKAFERREDTSLISNVPFALMESTIALVATSTAAL